MRLAPCIAFCLSVFFIQAQQFHAHLAINNFTSYPFYEAGRDTIVIGHDPVASDTLDAAFGETNIIGTAYDTILDVRISNLWGLANNPAYFGQTPYQTKKQITPDRCGTHTPSIIELNIKSKYWPVYVYWNKEEFADSCRKGTSLTNMSPTEWWTGTGFREVLAIWNYHPFNPSQYYTVQGSDTIYTYWVALGDSESVGLRIIDIQPNIQHAKLYPNPAYNQLNIEVPDGFNLSYTEFYTPDGTLILKTTETGLNIEGLNSGVYYVHLVADNRQRLVSKLIKL